MENSFLTHIKRFIQPEFIEALSLNSSDSKESLQKAYDVTIPSILKKINDSDSSVLQNILSKAQNVFTGSGDMNSRLSSVSNIISELFGSDYGTLKQSVSNYANISSTSTDSVLKTSFIGILDYFKDLTPDFDFSIIKNFISSKMPEINGLIPASLSGFAAANIPNFKKEEHVVNDQINKVVNENEKNQYKTNDSPYKDPKDDKSGNWFKYALIPLLLGVLVIFLLYRMCDNDNKTTEEVVVTQDTLTDDISTQTTTTTTVVNRESSIVKLHDGTELNAYKGGIEEQLVAFLDKGDYKNMSEDDLKSIWFDFDYLNFDTAKSTITTDTKIQLDNIAAILKAYPDAMIKIGGYTDKTGDENFNKKLSNDRANAVKSYLSDKGFGAQIDGAEGYGSEHAKYAADAPEEQRVLDRRVSLSVRNK